MHARELKQPLYEVAGFLGREAFTRPPGTVSRGPTQASTAWACIPMRKVSPTKNYSVYSAEGGKTMPYGALVTDTANRKKIAGIKGSNRNTVAAWAGMPGLLESGRRGTL